MQKNLKSLIAVAAFVTLAGAGMASAQSQSPRQDPSTPSERPRETMVSGELVSRDPGAEGPIIVDRRAAHGRRKERGRERQEKDTRRGCRQT